MPTTGRIFIVDDNLYAAEMLEELLRREGYTVAKTARGEEALTRIPAYQPDLVLLSARLPDIDSFTLHYRLKESDATRDVPFVFMSAHDDPEMRHRGFATGDDLITKPFDNREILARVERQVTVYRVRMALRESEAKFQSVMESAIDAIISADVSGKIRAWNPAASQVFGYTAQEAIGQPLELIIPPQYHDAHRTGINRVSSGGESRVIGKTVELSAIRKGGIEFPIELSLATWFLDEDRYYTGIIRDISERKQAEQKFRSVTESAIDAIISADHNGIIVSWNSAATAILGFTGEEAVGQPLEIIIPERHHEAHRAGMDRVTQRGDSRVIGSTVELHARTKEGHEIPIELSLSTWTVHDERYYTGIIRDISERKHAESQLRDYAEELARQHEELKLAQSQLIESEKQAMLGRLLAGILHELNTPLGVLRSSAHSVDTILERCRAFLKAGADGERPNAESLLKALDVGDQLTASISESAMRIEDIVDGLSHLISLDSAERKLHDLRDGIKTVLSVLSPQIVEGIQVTTDFPDRPVHVLCDPARLNQAILNILQNAITAVGRKGTIAVRAGIQAGRVQVTITDDGPGMTADVLKNAFEFSFSEREGRVRLRLGLATSRRTIEAIGGTLQIDSTPGQGTQVTIALPATAPA